MAAPDGPEGGARAATIEAGCCEERAWRFSGQALIRRARVAARLRAGGLLRQGGPATLRRARAVGPTPVLATSGAALLRRDLTTAWRRGLFGPAVVALRGPTPESSVFAATNGVHARCTGSPGASEQLTHVIGHGVGVVPLPAAGRCHDLADGDQRTCRRLSTRTTPSKLPQNGPEMARHDLGLMQACFSWGVTGVRRHFGAPRPGRRGREAGGRAPEGPRSGKRYARALRRAGATDGRRRRTTQHCGRPDAHGRVAQPWGDAGMQGHMCEQVHGCPNPLSECDRLIEWTEVIRGRCCGASWREALSESACSHGSVSCGGGVR